LLAALLHEQGRPEAADAWLAAARTLSEKGYAFLLEQERSLAFPLLSAYQTAPDAAVARTSALLLEGLRRVPPPPLQIALLGGFVVRQGHRIVEERLLRQRRAGELLALLALSPGHRLTAEQVAEALFPARPPAAAQTSFHHATSALRHALEPDLPDKFPSRYLTVEEGKVALTLPVGSRLDVEMFEAYCRRQAWEEALSLYGGELLAEYRYAAWTQLPRERIALLYQRALFGAAEARLAAGRPAEALDACRRLLALEPWHEGAVLLGMRACVALGDVAGARRLYLQLAQTLRTELDTAPQDELQAYFRKLTPPATVQP
jgi:DNA-binding SARP family transcriptional activator